MSTVQCPLKTRWNKYVSCCLIAMRHEFCYGTSLRAGTRGPHHAESEFVVIVVHNSEFLLLMYSKDETTSSGYGGLKYLAASSGFLLAQLSLTLF